MMTRAELIEEVAFELECLSLCTAIAVKYRNSRIGLKYSETTRLLKERVRQQTCDYRKRFGESLEIKILEKIV